MKNQAILHGRLQYVGLKREAADCVHVGRVNF